MDDASENPIADLLIRGKHPFPADMEQLIREIASVQPSALDGLDTDAVRWARGESVDEGRSKLQRILAELKSELSTEADDLEGLGDLLG